MVHDTSILFPRTPFDLPFVSYPIFKFERLKTTASIFHMVQLLVIFFVIIVMAILTAMLWQFGLLNSGLFTSVWISTIIVMLLLPLLEASRLFQQASTYVIY